MGDPNGYGYRAVGCMGRSAEKIRSKNTYISEAMGTENVTQRVGEVKKRAPSQEPQSTNISQMDRERIVSSQVNKERVYFKKK